MVSVTTGLLDSALHQCPHEFAATFLLERAVAALLYESAAAALLNERAAAALLLD